MTKPPFYVITGGPGSGKTTVLAELARRGYICVPEDARTIIQEQVAGGGSAVRWADAPLFAELLMRRSIVTYQQKVAQHPQTSVYFDRGIGMPSPARISSATHCPLTCASKPSSAAIAIPSFSRPGGRRST